MGGVWFAKFWPVAISRVVSINRKIMSGKSPRTAQKEASGSN